MQIGTMIIKMFPEANYKDFEVERYPDDSWKITKWNLPFVQPTAEEFKAYWDERGAEIEKEQYEYALANGWFN